MRVAEKIKARVHCPICTHTVEADVEVMKRKVWVVSGQKCPRCSAILDAAAVVQVPEAA
jgi:hypothetical protein